MESNLVHKDISKPSWKLYQEFVDAIFGENVVEIKPTPKDNNIIGTLQHTDNFSEFRKNFASRLLRLKSKFEHSEDYKSILNQVKLIADPNNWEGAYAELVAYDIMHNDCHGEEFKLDISMPATVSFADDLGGGETNEDIYLPNYGVYFDVKCLSDTVGIILKGIIKEAVDRAGLQGACDILPEYPLDDSEEDYQINRKRLMEELKDFLMSNPSSRHCKSVLNSKVLSKLNYRILWKKGVNSSIGEYGPYEHAEKTQHFILRRYTKKFMKNKPFMLVFVNFPWYNNRINDFCDFDEIYYRSIARRTFCGYMHSTLSANSILPKYRGIESLHEISRHLSGIIIIDDHSIKSDTYSCHIYTNPNAIHPIPNIAGSYLHEIIRQADTHSIYDDFKHDNY